MCFCIGFQNARRSAQQDAVLPVFISVIDVTLVMDSRQMALATVCVNLCSIKYYFPFTDLERNEFSIKLFHSLCIDSI